MTTVNQPRAPRRRRVDGRWPSQSDWEAFGLYGVKYADAMKAAADMRRAAAGRLERIDAFLATTEEQYREVTEDRKEQPAKEALRAIREWFSGELEIACRALGLDSGEVGETAAVHEYDHGYARRQAEIMALRAHLQHCGRYDERTRALVEDGTILDIARRFLDDMEARKLLNPENPADKWKEKSQ